LLSAKKEVVEELKQRLSVCLSNLDKYIGHLARKAYGAMAQKLTIDSLSNGQCLIIFDHKQKWLPKKFRETQQDNFAKRGVSLFGATAIMPAPRLETEADGGMLIHTQGSVRGYICSIYCAFLSTAM
jgi:hypothetical protein